MENLISVRNALMNHPRTCVSALPNGLRVATEQTNGSTASLGLWINTGTRFERFPHINGVAHFLEHLFFKGTERRSRVDLESEIENYGGHLNAYTSREQTAFYANSSKDDIEKSLDILADMLQYSKFEPRAMEHERDTIMREMESVNQQMQEVIFDKLHEAAFPSQPLGRNILGTATTVTSVLMPQHIRVADYYDTHYTAPRMVLACCSPFTHSQIEELAAKYFSSLPSTPRNAIEPLLLPAQFVSGESRTAQSTNDLTHIAFSFDAPGWSDSETIPAMLIRSMLGNWDASIATGSSSVCPLIRRIASDHLAQSVLSFCTQYSDAGLFGVYTVTKDSVSQTVLQIVSEEMCSFREFKDEERLEIAKNQLIMEILGLLDNSTAVCEDIGRQMVAYGRRLHLLELVDRIQSVDSQTIAATAQHLIRRDKFALAVVGPHSHLPSFSVIKESI